MTNLKFNTILSQLVSALPDSLRPMKAEFEAQLRQGIQLAIQKMDLVTREEFDVQTQVLAKTRKLLKTLEAQVQQLEQESLKNPIE